MSDKTLVWEDPPPDGRGRNGPVGGIRQNAIALAREHPGKWLLVKEYASSGSTGGATSLFRKEGCEVAVRGRAVYIRWPEVA